MESMRQSRHAITVVPTRSHHASRLAGLQSLTSAPEMLFAVDSEICYCCCTGSRYLRESNRPQHRVKENVVTILMCHENNQSTLRIVMLAKSSKMYLTSYLW